MEIKNRLRNIEEKMQKGAINIYLEDGSRARINRKEILDIIVAALDCNIFNSEPEPEYRFLLQVDESDSRNDKTVMLAKRLIQNRPVGGYDDVTE